MIKSAEIQQPYPLGHKGRPVYFLAVNNNGTDQTLQMDLQNDLHLNFVHLKLKQVVVS